MKTMIISIVLLCSCMFGFAQTLTLEVRDVEKPKGYLYVAIYNSKESFMKKPAFALRAEVKDKVVKIPCKGLPVGTYAISLFQDENGNGILDTGSFGRPLEKYGFSNDAEGVMGAPSYEKCCFEFTQDKVVMIHLK